MLDKETSFESDYKIGKYNGDTYTFIHVLPMVHE